MFTSVEALRHKFEQAKYIVDEVMISQVYVAGQLRKPVLIEGPPGCGKTELAKALAFAMDTSLERLQGFIAKIGVAQASRTISGGSDLRC